MRTINEVCETYKAVFEGKKVLLNGYELTSDGVNWIVNNTPIDTIANKKKEIVVKLSLSILILFFVCQFWVALQKSLCFFYTNNSGMRRIIIYEEYKNHDEKESCFKPIKTKGERYEK